MIRSLVSHRYNARIVDLLCCGAFCFLPSTAKAQNPGLNVSISGPHVNGDVTNSITIKNFDSIFSATGVALNHRPAGAMTLAFLIFPVGFSCTIASVGEGGTISCTGGTIPPDGQVGFMLVGRMPAGATCGATFTDTAASAFNADLNSTNSTAAALNNSADLCITNSGPATSNPVPNMAHTIVMMNSGRNMAFSPTATDSIPGGLRLFSNTGGCVVAFPCSLTAPPSGQSATSAGTYGTTRATSGEITNTALVSAATLDPGTKNHSASSANEIRQADLSVTQTGPATAIVGSNISYTITVSNAGPSAASIAGVTDTLPAGTTLVSATPSMGSCTGTNTVICGLGRIANGSSATITLVLHLDAAGAISNTATAFAITSDPTPGNNSATASTTVIAAPTFGKALGLRSSIPFNGSTLLSFPFNDSNFTTTKPRSGCPMRYCPASVGLVTQDR